MVSSENPSDRRDLRWAALTVAAQYFATLGKDQCPDHVVWVNKVTWLADNLLSWLDGPATDSGTTALPTALAEHIADAVLRGGADEFGPAPSYVLVDRISLALRDATDDTLQAAGLARIPF